MRLFKGSEVKPFTAAKGETVIQYTGRLDKHGRSKFHSLAIMILQPGLSSDPHAHEIAEESFLVIRGNGVMKVNEDSFEVGVGDCVFVEPGERHTLVNTGTEPLECVLATGPAWQPTDSI
mgnify:CR=1 FL=1